MKEDKMFSLLFWAAVAVNFIMAVTLIWFLFAFIYYINHHGLKTLVDQIWNGAH